MAQFVLYLKLPDYLDQWLKHEFFDLERQCVVFPKGSTERIILELFLAKQPKGLKPCIDRKGMTVIAIPDFSAKPAHTYNYLPPKGAAALISTIKKRFKVLMWDELHVIRQEDVQIMDIVYAFLEKYGIEQSERNWETVRQMYARLRKVYKNQD